ncbi:lipopolysaccharide transport periplasmic protein LptA [Lysobacter solisilvae (ex Woo and Kim 2020)]|uniref:Lipopolysaccharide transport periplasmic protein LptA n=1 Tax=Agrilutibacter terrestris TaxID=2865112 RepID=A0A7H0FYR2_9GAMM|nr:lipopolysaccharide transport periplasmic protein LptA [Lysobacter terrestris]QNP41178.1 lipopolysaccharide transport periplasmic protein LptA [Lysobacter terrestris]
MSRLPVKSLAALLAGTSVLLLASSGAWAKSSDRGQAMDIEAGATSGSLDDRQPTVLSNGVTISQGSLQIEANTATITTRGGEPVRAILTGGPVKLKQQLDDGTPMNATAGKVDYDLTTEVVIFTDKVNIQQPRGSLSGPRVVYNMKTGMVNSSADSSGRVKMTIQPKQGQAAPAPAPAKPAPKKGTN